jgi:hypothetical protein
MPDFILVPIFPNKVLLLLLLSLLLFLRTILQLFFIPLYFSTLLYLIFRITIYTRGVFLVLDKPKFFISFYYLNIIENNKNLSSKNIFKYFDFAYVQIS